ncbi:MAG: septation protein A [Gallionellaceae bacterium]|jgi:intracellular septation protein
MKILFDLFPVILFFVFFKLFGVYAATASAIVATLAQVAWVKYRHGKVDTMLWVSLGIIVIFGGATLLLHDETFIKWKPTVLYWFFAGALLLSRPLFGKNLIHALLHEKMALPPPVWHYLNLAWSAFFALLGFVNLYVAYNFSLDSWVNFKLFGATSLMFVFILLQAAVISKYAEEDKKDAQ